MATPGHRNFTSRPPSVVLVVLVLVLFFLADVVMLLTTGTGEPTDVIAELGVADRTTVVLELPLQGGPLGRHVGCPRPPVELELGVIRPLPSTPGALDGTKPHLPRARRACSACAVAKLGGGGVAGKRAGRRRQVVSG